MHGDLSTAVCGRDHLKSRELGSWDIVDRYKLGVVAEPLPGDERFTGRLVVPYLTPAGPRAVKYRCIACWPGKCEGHRKYDQPAGQEQRLFNAMAYHSGLDYIGVAEGEIDAITASEHLGVPTMAVPGATQWSSLGQYWELTLRDFDAVFVFADGDKPGLDLAKQIAGDVGWRARIVQCPDGEDVNSMVVAGRSGELKKKAGL